VDTGALGTMAGVKMTGHCQPGAEANLVAGTVAEVSLLPRY
jgi:hypothetical protein